MQYVGLVSHCCSCKKIKIACEFFCFCFRSRLQLPNSWWQVLISTHSTRVKKIPSLNSWWLEFICTKNSPEKKMYMVVRNTRRMATQACRICVHTKRTYKEQIKPQRKMFKVLQFYNQKYFFFMVSFMIDRLDTLLIPRGHSRKK